MGMEEIRISLANASQDVKESLAKLKIAINEADKAERIAAIEGGMEVGAISDSITEEIKMLLSEAMDLFSHFGKTFTVTDRTRLIGTGIKNFGFIETSFNSASTNPQLLPQYLKIDKYKDGINDFRRKQSISLLIQQFGKNVSDGMLSAGDAAYHDSLEYYEAVKEASRHRVPGAEQEYDLLKKYFKRSKPTIDPTAEKE
jgi:hypothetical protein